jgi:ribosome-associated protein
MSKREIQKQVVAAFHAAEEKKATDISLLKLDKSSSGFTDYFLVCSGSNPRQIQTIADEVQDQLEKIGQRVTHIEGYQQAEWVLLDYVDFVVHIFNEQSRKYYDLERLWKSAEKVRPEQLMVGKARPEVAAKKPSPPRKAAARKTVPKKKAAPKSRVVKARKKK